MVMAGALLFFATTQASDRVTRVLLWGGAAFAAPPRDDARPRGAVPASPLPVRAS